MSKRLRDNKLTNSYAMIMSSPSEIVSATIDYIGSDVLSCPSQFIDVFMERAEEIYFEQERQAIQEVIRETYGESGIEQLIEELDLLMDFFMSVFQSRRARAGRALETAISILFWHYKIPFESARINGKPDFIIPSVEAYRDNPLNCFVLTTKRKVRERWRQIVTEGARIRVFHLFTLDTDLSNDTIREMSQNGVKLVTTAKIKEDHYADNSNVITIEEFIDSAIKQIARY